MRGGLGDGGRVVAFEAGNELHEWMFVSKPTTWFFMKASKVGTTTTTGTHTQYYIHPSGSVAPIHISTRAPRLVHHLKHRKRSPDPRPLKPHPKPKHHIPTQSLSMATPHRCFRTFSAIKASPPSTTSDVVPVVFHWGRTLSQVRPEFEHDSSSVLGESGSGSVVGLVWTRSELCKEGSARPTSLCRKLDWIRVADDGNSMR
jgi:hypothetical protein